jgi:hypothetical protein
MRLHIERTLSPPALTPLHTGRSAKISKPAERVLIELAERVLLAFLELPLMITAVP